MIRSIWRARSIDRRIAEIRRSGKKGELAVNQYQRIIAVLKSRSPEAADVFGKRTKHGECRMRNCIKYDLGSGYRLITVRVDDRLYIPFIGDHDEADLWLERRRNDGFQPSEAVFREEAVVTVEADACGGEEEGKRSDGDSYEEELRAKLDDSLLKAVFGGLYQHSPEWKRQQEDT